MTNYDEAYNRIELCVLSACDGMGLSPYKNNLLSREPAQKDLAVVKDAIDKADKLDKLESELGCPIEVYVKLSQADSIITKEPERLIKANANSSITNIVQSRITLGENEFYVKFEIVDPYTLETFGTETVELFYKDYPKTWWLKEDKSE